MELLEESTMKQNSYEMIIWWSAEDDAYVVEVPELPGCMAHGATRQAAIKNAKDAVKFWIKTAKEDGQEFGVVLRATCRRCGADADSGGEPITVSSPDSAGDAIHGWAVTMAISCLKNSGSSEFTSDLRPSAIVRRH